MCTTITANDKTFEKLMQLTGKTNKTEAVNLAIREFIRQEHLRSFKKLCGQLDLPSNEGLDAAELEAVERFAGED